MGINGDNKGVAVSSRDGRLLLEIPASLESVDRAVETARAFFSRGRGRANLFPVLTSLREALINAAVHGCALDGSLWVRCQLGVEDGMALVEVSDPGPGFDWRGLPPRSPAPEMVSGRGLAILNHYSRKLHFNDKGNEVVFMVDLEARS
ncbi:MAG: ATP-binding protein [Thermodesulfobacteriota bacterium]